MNKFESFSLQPKENLEVIEDNKAFFPLEGIAKHLMTVPTGNSEFCCPRPSIRGGGGGGVLTREWRGLISNHISISAHKRKK